MSAVPWKGYFTFELVSWRGGYCVALWLIVCVVSLKYLNIIIVFFNDTYTEH